MTVFHSYINNDTGLCIEKFSNQDFFLLSLHICDKTSFKPFEAYHKKVSSRRVTKEGLIGHNKDEKLVFQHVGILNRQQQGKKLTKDTYYYSLSFRKGASLLFQGQLVFYSILLSRFDKVKPPLSSQLGKPSLIFAQSQFMQ